MENFNEIIGGDRPVLVDFFATWCGPCKMMQPVLEELKKMTGDAYRIIKIDIDKPASKRLMVTYGVRSVPTLIVFRRGEALWRQSGVMTAQELKEVLERS